MPSNEFGKSAAQGRPSAAALLLPFQVLLKQCLNKLSIICHHASALSHLLSDLCCLSSVLCPLSFAFPTSEFSNLSSALRHLLFSNNKQPVTNNKFYYFSFADWSRACSRTLAPASQSSHLVFSTSTWLRPPMLGTNTMAVGHTWFM